MTKKRFYELELFNYNLKNKYVTLIEEDMFDEFKLMHPFTTEDQTELIRNNILDNIQTVIDLFYNNGEFDETNVMENI